MLIYFFMGLTIVLAFITAYVQEKGQLGIKFVIKSLASFSFMVIAFLALGLNKKVEYWHIGMIIGLLLGLMGDIFLATNGIVERRYILPFQLAGVIFFLLGHIVYLAMFFILAGGYKLYLLPIIIIFPIIMYILIKKKVIICRPQEAIIPILAYAVVIGTMLSFAINSLILIGGMLGQIIFIGALLFCTSDFLLSFYVMGDFATDRKKNIIAFIYTPFYFIAQALLAFIITL